MTYDFGDDWASIHKEDEDREQNDKAARTSNHDPRAVQDAHIAETVANRALRDRYCWAAGLNWMKYRRGCWSETTEANVAERVRCDLIDQHAREARAGAEADRLKSLSGLLSGHRIRALVTLAKGILEVDPADFDQHPDLLNVGNGVVDLPTGQLRPHDPALLLTKITPVTYVPSATSPDWEAALRALPRSVGVWMQIRIGQAATGHPTPDDIMPVAQGGGSNGKTTFTGAIARALGSHAVTVPERVLIAHPSDHPTELMTLRGARLALIEETPEARHLSVKRLKDTVGTPTMTARYIGRNNVTWDATHSLLLSTNYMPRVDETDHGTWRRLALVRFPYTFYAPNESPAGRDAREGDVGLRERLRDGSQGQHQAVLAWIIEGARTWYAHDRVMPPPPSLVKHDTSAWRAEADLMFAYISERLSFDRDCHIISAELFADFSAWLTTRGHKAWADQTLSARFAGHGMVEAANVEKVRTRGGSGLSRTRDVVETPPAQYNAWHGVRFRSDTDDHVSELAAHLQAIDQAGRDLVQPVQGHSEDSHTKAHSEATEEPLHALHTLPRYRWWTAPDAAADKLGSCGRCQQPHSRLVGRDTGERPACGDCADLPS